MTRFPPLVSRLIPSLGRENDNEVVTTVRAIGAALKGHGHDWHDLAHAIERSGHQPIVFSPSTTTTSGAPSFGDMARACRDLDLDRGCLAPLERRFVTDMCRRGFSYRPSPRQLSWLTDIFDKLNQRAAA